MKQVGTVDQNVAVVYCNPYSQPKVIQKNQRYTQKSMFTDTINAGNGHQETEARGESHQ
jgi:hypothetical protein